MPVPQKRAPVFLALLEEAITSTRPRSFPERFSAQSGDDAQVVRANRTLEAIAMRAQDRALSSRPRALAREAQFRPTKVVSGEGPIAAPRPRSDLRAGPSSHLSREEALETAREVAREQAAQRHYKMARELSAEARELSSLAAQLAAPTALPLTWDDGPFAEDVVRGWPRH